MTAIIDSASRQKQYKERACKQRVIVLPLGIGEKEWESYRTACRR